MAWERRGDGGRYYYRGRRTPDGRVVKRYLGRGERAEAAAAADALAEARREDDRRAVREEMALLAGPDALTAGLLTAAEVLMQATLLAAGFHRPNFGPWRRKRGGDQEPKS